MIRTIVFPDTCCHNAVFEYWYMVCCLKKNIFLAFFERFPEISTTDLPFNRRSNWAWVMEDILVYGNRLRSTHCREFHYMNLCRPAYFVRTTQLLPHTYNTGVEMQLSVQY